MCSLVTRIRAFDKEKTLSCKERIHCAIFRAACVATVQYAMLQLHEVGALQ